MNAILIIENSTQDSDILSSNLIYSGIGNPIRVVLTYEDAVKYLEGVGEFVDRDRYPFPAVIFLKVPMPGLDSFAFLSWLKSRRDCRGVLVIAVGGGDDFSAIRRAYQMGIHSFLTHPSRIQEVENLIKGYPGPWQQWKGVERREEAP
jgi:CheY-like chemotaxis protein